MWITTNCGKFLERWGYQIALPASCETCQEAGQEAAVRTRYGTTDRFKFGKEICQGCYCQPAYLTYMQSTS